VDASDVRSAAHARNVGAEAATGKILALCDGDDIVEPDWLRNLVAALEPDTAVGGHLDEAQLAVPGQQNWRPPATPGRLPTFLDHPYVVTANMAMYRKDFAAAGGFDLSLIRCEDIAFSFKLLDNGITLTYAEDAVVHYRHRQGLRSLLHQHYLYGQGLAQVLARDGLPGGASKSGIGALRPNAQPVAKWSVHQFLRRGALGVGRVVGVVRERLGR
jgi:GT2 family glycosyltransferase